MLAKILKKLGIERDPPPIEKEKEVPNIIIDTGEDILSISPSLIEKNEATTNDLFIGNHLEGCWDALCFYNLKKYKVIHCHRCSLRIKVPVEVTTAEELKEFLQKE